MPRHVISAAAADTPSTRAAARARLSLQRRLALAIAETHIRPGAQRAVRDLLDVARAVSGAYLATGDYAGLEGRLDEAWATIVRERILPGVESSFMQGWGAVGLDVDDVLVSTRRGIVEYVQAIDNRIVTGTAVNGLTLSQQTSEAFRGVITEGVERGWSTLRVSEELDYAFAWDDGKGTWRGLTRERLAAVDADVDAGLRALGYDTRSDYDKAVRRGRAAPDTFLDSNIARRDATARALRKGEGIVTPGGARGYTTHGWRARSERIARTESIGAYNAGTMQAANDMQSITGREGSKRWLATFDDRTRDAHYMRDGECKPSSGTFSGGLRYPGDPSGSAAETINCLTSSARIAPVGKLLAVYRARVDGPTYRIETASGDHFTATAHHKVLTRSGWKCAHALDLGDELLSADSRQGMSSSLPDVRDVPPTIRKVYRALRQAGCRTERVRGRRVNFHGDLPVGEVEVVTVDLDLLAVDPPDWQQVSERDLRWLRSAAGLLFDGSDLATHVGASDDLASSGSGSAARSVSGSSTSSAFLERRLSGVESLLFPDAPALHSAFVEAANDEGAADPERLREAVRRLSVDVPGDEVVKIKSNPLQGSSIVYTVETSTGAYRTATVVHRNCRCTMTVSDVGCGEDPDAAAWADAIRDDPAQQAESERRGITPVRLQASLVSSTSLDEDSAVAFIRLQEPLPLATGVAAMYVEGTFDDDGNAVERDVATRWSRAYYSEDRRWLSDVTGTMDAYVEANESLTAAATAEGMHWQGTITIEGRPTGDGRMFESGALRWEVPFPLTYDPETGGHGGPAIGTVLSVVREGDEINAAGTFDLGSDIGREAARQAAEGLTVGLSIEPDEVSMRVEIVEDLLSSDVLEDEGPSPLPAGDDGRVVIWEMNADDEVAITSDARIRTVAQVTTPAFDETVITLAPGVTLDTLLAPTEEAIAASSLPASFATLVAASAPVTPPRSYFDNPNFSMPTPGTVTDGGRVMGHLAVWGQCHTAYEQCVSPPASPSNYAFFATGALVCDDGSEVAVGQLTLAGGHAPDKFNAARAIAHYDNTDSAFADVVCGEDEHGIWYSGALRPGVTDEAVRVFRASPLSGDWRRIGGALELVAACCVNSQGFPIPRPSVVVSSGAVVTQLAAGMLAPSSMSSPSAALTSDERAFMQRLMRREAAERTATLRRRVHGDDDALIASLTSRVHVE